MTSFPKLLLLTLAMTSVIARADDWLDRLDDSLAVATEDGAVRARFSGLLDLEAWHFWQQAPGLIVADGHNLINPRLSLFFDAQLGPHLYVFLQSRIDRGFDPADGPAQVRLDEYAVRWTPWDDSRFNLQAGKFGTVVGNWIPRHDSWENPFINAPLIYETVTPAYDSGLPSYVHSLAEGFARAKYSYNPVIWGPSYATGVAISGRLNWFDYAFELKNAPLSSRPSSWDPGHVDFDHPTVSGRLGWRPDAAWNLGISASEGAYLLDSFPYPLPAGKGIGDFQQVVLGQDLAFAWHHWQLWAEVYEARFDRPRGGHGDTLGWYVEAKYKFTTRVFAALRWNQLMYGGIESPDGRPAKWSSDLWRADISIGYRITAHSQLKLQLSLPQPGRGETGGGTMMAAQLTVRF